MKWDGTIIDQLTWSKPIANIEGKREVARQLANRVQDGEFIGFGSGSTSYLAIQAIAESLKERRITCTAIVTSLEIEFLCAGLGIRTTSLVDVKPDWAFDGADEVDPAGNLIKGRGGAMFREKLLIDSALKTFILVDRSKLVEKLGQKFPVPVEVFPMAINLVTRELSRLGASELKLRLATGKDGPIITENGHLIVDASFNDIQPDLEKQIKTIPGVIESGLFQGRKPEVLVSAG